MYIDWIDHNKAVDDLLSIIEEQKHKGNYVLSVALREIANRIISRISDSSCAERLYDKIDYSNLHNSIWCEYCDRQLDNGKITKNRDVTCEHCGNKMKVKVQSIEHMFVEK